MESGLNTELNLAVEAAKTAGRVIKDKLYRHSITNVKSCPSDLVTEVDVQAEEIITGMIRKQFPDHAIVGEESPESHSFNQGNKLTWYIDPLDGTTNFVFGLSFCAVSIALANAGKPVLGVVYDPFRDELFSAARGQGALLNGSPVQVDGEIRALNRSLLVTGFPGNIQMRPAMHRVNLRKVIDSSSNLRALGSAALELAYVACGRLTGFWEVALRPWDVAAGMLLVEEAGGKVTNLTGDNLGLTPYINITATNRHIHRELLAALEWAEG